MKQREPETGFNQAIEQLNRVADQLSALSELIESMVPLVGGLSADQRRRVQAKAAELEAVSVALVGVTAMLTGHLDRLSEATKGDRPGPDGGTTKLNIN